MVKRRRRQRKSHNTETIFLFIILLAVAGSLLVPYRSFIDQINLLLLVVVVALIPLLVGAAIYFWFQNKRKRENYYMSLQVIAQFLAMRPYEFEKFIGWVFEKMDYEVEVTRASADHGLDVMLAKDGKHYAVQVKRYAMHNRVTEAELRDFYGSFAGGETVKGFFVTTSDFTTPAREWAQTRPIELITGNDLVRLVRSFEESSWQELVLGHHFKSQ